MSKAEFIAEAQADLVAPGDAVCSMCDAMRGNDVHYAQRVLSDPKIRLTQFGHGGGCGCKIAPAVRSDILPPAPIRGLPKELMVGTATADDAAVYRLNGQAAEEHLRQSLRKAIS